MKLVLCGTNYGATYLPAIEPAGFELAGILARGSQRSVDLAAKSNVPFWSNDEEVVDDVCVAVIALPPPAAETVAKRLLSRGIHVLFEFPVAADVLEDLRAHATRANVVLNVNCHFGELAAARAFVQECQRRLRIGPAQYASVVTAPRLAYATFDLLGRALGGLSKSGLVQETSNSEIEHPFASFCGTVSGVPARVQCSRAIGPVDDGTDMPVPQRIEIGFKDGNLVLQSPVGPVVWSEQLRMALRDHPGPLWINLARESVTFTDLLVDRANANQRALVELEQQIGGEQEPAHQSTRWLTCVASLMQTVRSVESRIDQGR